MKKRSIFISYSHKDEAWKDRLIRHLRVLEKERVYTVWHDRQIAEGAEWEKEIKTAIQEAQVAVLLVSADFLGSDFICGVEIPLILEQREKGLRVFAVIVKPCAWQEVGWLSSMQLASKDGEPLSKGNDYEIEEELAALTRKIGDLFKKDKRTTAKQSVIETQPQPKQNKKNKSFCGVQGQFFQKAPLAAGGKTIFTPLPPEAVYLAKLPITGPDLFGREEQLGMLDGAWSDGFTRVVTVVAWGGVGKTALVNRWLNDLAQENYRGAERVYGWSFYSQGAAEGRQASADFFFKETLGRFGDPHPEEGTPEEKGHRLADLVRGRKTLLILDGLEPLQHPPHEAYGQEGRLKDRGLAVLLRQLAAAQPGLCVITSRERVADLAGQSGAAVREMNLEELSSAAGQALLKSLGVSGRDQEMAQAVAEYGGHALALTLLGNYVAVCCGGDIRKRDTIPGLTHDRRQGAHARRVMAAYCTHLEGSPELDILYLMGLFDRPADAGAIEVLRQAPAIRGVTDRLQDLSDEDWFYALASLRQAHLLAKENPINPGSLDCHPLIREYFGERLAHEHPQGFKAAHERLYHYYKDLPKKELPDTLEEMEPLFAAIAHGCAAGLHQSALYDVYWKQVCRGNEAFLNKKLGAFGSDIAALSHFFEKPWSIPAAGLNESDQALVLSWAAFGLRALGRLVEAAAPMRASLKSNVDREDWAESARISSNMSELLLTLGRVEEAVEYGRQSVDYADRSGYEFHKMVNRTALADALHQAGEREEAEALFRKAEKIQKKDQPEYTFLYSLPGFRYCDLLLAKGETRQVLEQMSKVLKEGEGYGDPLLDLALYKLSLGQVYLAQARELQQAGQKEKEKEALDRAGEFLRRAVDGLRQAGEQRLLVVGLLARAAYYREMGEYDKARADLDEALEIAQAGAMRLYLVDYHLEAARLCAAQDQQEEAAAHRAQAKRLIHETGYKRRIKELEKLK